MKFRLTRILSAAVLTAALCSLPSLEAKADEMSEELKSALELSVDVLLVRPLSVASCIFGAILYLPAVGMSYADGQSSLDEAKEIFVTIPYEYAFERTLGEF